MLAISFAHYGLRIRHLLSNLSRAMGRFAQARRRRGYKPLPIEGLNEHLRRDIGFDP